MAVDNSISSNKISNNENNNNPELSHILHQLRPFQREAYDFATRGILSSRQCCSASFSNNRNDDCTEETKKKKQHRSQYPTVVSRNIVYDNKDLLGQGRILLADEMGLGKSVTSLAIMAHYRSEWPLLILCPASLRHTWPGEIEKFIPTIPASCTYVVKGFDDADFFHNPIKRKSIQIVIATYSLLQQRSAAARVLQDFNFQCVIVDESHNLKQRTSQRTKFALPLLQKARRLVLLSGTPALARPVELWPQVYTLAPTLFGSYDAFTKEFCNARKGRFGWDVTGLSNADVLHGKLKQIMVRRLKADVLDELPAKQRSMVPIAILKSKHRECESLIKQLKETRQSVSDLVGEEANGAHFEARRLLMEAYQTCGVAKVEGVCEYLLEWLRGSGTQKVLVFAHHKAVMDAIETAVAREWKGVAHVRIDGTVPSQERAARVRKFQTSGQVRVAILSMTAAGVGLTLTAASCVMFAELHWTPGVLAQAEDRCHRIGQRNAVNVLYLVCDDPKLSVDMQLWQMLGRKVSNLGRVVDGENHASLDAQRASSSSLGATEHGIVGRSVQDELQSFFAETSTKDDTKAAGRRKVPAKGTILSFFNKQRQQQEQQPKQQPSPSEGASHQSPNMLSVTRENSFSTKPTISFTTPSTDKSKIEWTCEACTYHNSVTLKAAAATSTSLLCEMCETPHVNGRSTPTQITPIGCRIADTTTKYDPLERAADGESKITTTFGNNVVLDDTEVIEIDCVVSNFLSEPELKREEENCSLTDSTLRNHQSMSRKRRLLTDEEERTTANIGMGQEDASVLSFSVSKNSGRITIHYKNSPTHSMINFEVEQIMSKESSDRLLEARVARQYGDVQKFPIIFDREALVRVINLLDQSWLGPSYRQDSLIHEIESFVNQYMSLREIEKRWLKESGLSFSGPNLRQDVVRLMTQSSVISKKRYVGGAKERARERLEHGTASESDMAVLDGRLCAYCAGSLSAASSVSGVASTYCSQECVEQGRLKRGGMYSSAHIRSQVYALEGGVCRLCNIDAQALYTRISALEPAERLSALCNANWKLPKSAKALERLLQCPKEGDFWQADHIRPVAEGGGDCGLENLRTLCVPCHAGETEKLRIRLKLGTGKIESSTQRQIDIRTMFGG